MRLYSSSTLLLLLGSSIATVSVVAAAAADDDYPVFLWSSTGGGWRSMMACIGFANVFQQAGLFTDNSTMFRAIATNSGASWFSTQLFYSQAFYDKTVMAESPSDLNQFVKDWMLGYYEMTQDAAEYRENLLRLILTETDVTVGDIRDAKQTLAEAELGINFTELFSGNPKLPYNPIVLLIEFYDLYRYSNAQWGNFVEEMMSRAAETSFAADETDEDYDFTTIVANSKNRITPLQHTDLVVQTALSPFSKVRLSSADFNITETIINYGDTDLTGQWSYLAPSYGEIQVQDMAVYLGPTTATTNSDINSSTTIEEWEIYSPSISAYYLVNDTYEGFQYSSHHPQDEAYSTSTLATYSSPTSYRFRWDDKIGYYLYPNEGFWDQPTDPAIARTEASEQPKYNTMATNMTSTGYFQDPFGGGAASVIQVSAISSAAVAGASPAANPILAQALSLIRQEIIETNTPVEALVRLTAFDLAVQQLDESTILDNFAVCSQWPDAPCGPNDAYFLDGAYADNPSVASNIAQYQNSNEYDPNKTIKLVITNTNQEIVPNTFATRQFTQYFKTFWNENVTAGDYVWVPGFSIPILSPQIFEEYLSDEDLVNAIEPIDGYNHSTAILKGTTIHNAAFGTKAGQSVEILLMNLNEDITTFITGALLVDDLTEPLANMTSDLAANQELVSRVADFFFDADVDEEKEEAEGEEDDSDTDADAGDADTTEEGEVAATKDGSPTEAAGPQVLQSAAAGTKVCLKGTIGVVAAVAWWCVLWNS